MTDKIYYVEITRQAMVKVTNVEGWQEAKEVVREMYESGDAAAELGDARFSVVQIK